MNKTAILFIAPVCFLFSSCSWLFVPDSDGDAGPSIIQIKNMPPLVLASYSNVRFESIPRGSGGYITEFGYSQKNVTTAYFSMPAATAGTHFNTLISPNSNFNAYSLERKNYLNVDWRVQLRNDDGTGKRLSTVSGLFADIYEPAVFSLRRGIAGQNSTFQDVLFGEVVVYPWRTIRLYIEGVTEVQRNSILARAQETFRQAICRVEIVSNRSSANCVLRFGKHNNGRDFTLVGTNEVLADTDFHPTLSIEERALMSIGFRFGLGRPGTGFDAHNLMNTNHRYTHLNKTQWDLLHQNVR